MSARWRHGAAAVGTTVAAAVLCAAAALAAGSGTDPVATTDGPVTIPSLLDAVQGPTVTALPVVGPSVPTGTDAVAPNGVALFRISTETDSGLPRAARRAYVAAAASIARERPDCDLPWQLLAGIGRVETDHGRFGGSRLGVDGVSRPLIRGIALDGVGPVAAIRDSDGGRLDGDRTWDRAVGPMQFIPSTWRAAGRDGDGDGVRDPDDLDDAALAAAAYLCPTSGTILDETVMRRQVFAYNHSDYYVDLVIAFAIGYRTGVFDIPAPPVEPDPARPPTQVKPAKPPRPPGPGPTPSPTQQPTQQPTRPPTPPTQQPQPPQQPPPSQQPTQQPSPTPPPQPQLASATGPWTACGATWCVTGVPLDLGPADRYPLRAAEDFDADGTVETTQAELDGLVGRAVTVTVRRGTRVVYLLDGLGYRNADGSFATAG